MMVLADTNVVFVSVEIAQFEEYTQCLIDHLIALKFNHFDTSIRNLTAQALANLTPLYTDYVRAHTIPVLVTKCIDSDTYTAHGALLSLGSILKRLQEIDRLDLPADVLKAICDITPSVIKRKFGGSQKGNDFLRQGLNFFINSCSVARYVRKIDYSLY
jgi:hypothetical protein